MERCIGIQWGPGLLRPFDGSPPCGFEFPPGQEILTEDRDGLKLHYKHGDNVSQIVLRRFAEFIPVISLMVRRDEITVEPFLVWGQPSNGEASR